MVLGLKSKHKKGAVIKVDYIVHVQEIRPWPPSESLKSVQTVLLQWENGDQNSGSFLTVAGDSNIVFNESFMLPLTLYQKKASDKFRKNYLEFSLFEPRKDKAKGQLLGTALFNLADYALIEDVLSINAPLNLKKNGNNLVQPALVISLELVARDSSNSSPSVGLSLEASLEDDDDDLEITSYTDDDASSHSSRTAGSSNYEGTIASPSQSDKNGYGNAGIDHTKERNGNLDPSSAEASSDNWKKVNGYVALRKFSERSMTYVKKNSATPLIKSSPSSISFRDTNGKFNNIVANSMQGNVEDKSFERFASEVFSADHYRKNGTNANSPYYHASQEKEFQSEVLLINDAHVGWGNDEKRREQKDGERDEHIMEGTNHVPEKSLLGKFLSENDTKSHDIMRNDMLVPNRQGAAIPPSSSNKARLKHVKSVQIHGSIKGNGFLADIYGGGKPPDLDIPRGSQKKGKPKGDLSDSKNEWRNRVEMLEEELREAAAIEVGLYSIVAEHSSSGNKVHTPARRLSRFYNNACRTGSQAKRACAARAALSGLVLVSKACGNDVTRLTFWLSNSIMLRAIVSQTAAELPHSSAPTIKSNGAGPELTSKHPNRRVDSSLVEGQKSSSIGESDDWEDVLTFIIAVEKVEAWLFSRIVESVWWQTFTPHMQPTITERSYRSKGSGKKKTSGKRNTLGNHEQVNYSIELWKKAFKDACERLCPIRAGGRECGCLSALVIRVMEQLVNRLDVAMFNAILRESAKDMPTDPVSDPICDSNVLPVPAGKSSFGAGAQLKNVIGNWSRWLTDLFGLEDDSTEDNVLGNSKRSKSFKAFRLLHALSDLMMLPFGMLADASTRKEVCPTFGPAIIKRVLNNFVPDEFCPYPIPRNIINALDSEEISDSLGDVITTFPCRASLTKYSPPPAALLTCVGEVGRQVLKSSRLSTLKKSYTSDDELDELDSPLISIIPDSCQSSSALAKLSLMPKEKGGRNVLRYQLLREIWRGDE
ncbi:uncharacterized protein LOC105168391 [Sesamum indicum]|uniref:Uncharacterized protein LOC105168391 n=1 Tax=Sesamum indicum TaxID=4182 RepID=A0A6I9TLM6_SESIN|nr:uncharacterized protein LOC105168391 [Sesamum indicum]XP_011086758.1 uncharacterized protein LOC105168391 [Sesamum indicum]